MCTRATLAEVRKLQKAAGILNENDIDYSLDEILDDEGMLNEKMNPCGYLMIVGGSMAGQRHDLTMFSDGHGHFSCFDLNSANGRVDLRGYTQVPDSEIDWSIARQQRYSAESVQEDAVPKPTKPAACPPGYTAYATGLDPNVVACLQGPAPKSINGKPPKKITPTTPLKTLVGLKPGMKPQI